jgi:hypothetical protein
MPATRDDGRITPAFGVSDTVRARNIEVTGHTRLPRYFEQGMSRPKEADLFDFK